MWEDQNASSRSLFTGQGSPHALSYIDGTIRLSKYPESRSFRTTHGSSWV